MAVYGLQADQELNKGSQLYIPGQTKMNAGDVFLGGAGTGVTDAMIGPATRVAGDTRLGTQSAYNAYQANNINNASSVPSTTVTPTPAIVTDTTSTQADAIKAAQSAAAATTKAAYDNQLAAQIGTYATQRAAIPGQTTVANNQASSQGMVNADHIRNALSQMGLLQSGESASQQLTNDVGTASNINANNLQEQALDAGFADKIATAQAQSAIDYNAAVRQQQSTDNQNTQWQQSFDQQKAQDAANNAFNQSQFDNYWHGTDYNNGVAQTPTTSNDTYGFQADVNANPGKNIRLYVPGQTQMGAGDVFLGGTAVLSNDKLNGAQRVWGNNRQDTAKEYTKYLEQRNSASPAALPSSLAYQYPGATNVVKTANGYNFTSSTGSPVYYVP